MLTLEKKLYRTQNIYTRYFSFRPNLSAHKTLFQVITINIGLSNTEYQLFIYSYIKIAHILMQAIYSLRKFRLQHAIKQQLIHMGHMSYRSCVIIY